MDKLTLMLAARLAAIVLPGFRVEADAGMLSHSCQDGRLPGQLGDHSVGRSGTFVRDNLAGYGQPEQDAIIAVAAQALSELQDYVDEATHDPWPRRRGMPPRQYAEVRGQMLHLWYGGPDINAAAVLACEPIPLGDLHR